MLVVNIIKYWTTIVPFMGRYIK